MTSAMASSHEPAMLKPIGIRTLLMASFPGVLRKMGARPKRLCWPTTAHFVHSHVNHVLLRQFWPALLTPPTFVHYRECHLGFPHYADTVRLQGRIRSRSMHTCPPTPADTLPTCKIIISNKLPVPAIRLQTAEADASALAAMCK